MKKLLAVAALSATFATGGSAAEMTGYISDDSCAARSSQLPRATDWIVPEEFEACAKHCLKDGSQAVFVTEDNKVLRLDAGSNAKAMPLIGHRVKVTGTATSTTLTVETISAIAMKPRPGTKANGDNHADR